MQFLKIAAGIAVSLALFPGIVFAATPTHTPTSTPTPTSLVHTSSCNSFAILSGNNQTVPSTVTFRVQGSDNKGTIQGYKYFYGDGTQDETTSSEIAHRYEVSGTFFARAEVKDSNGVWKSGSSCETVVQVQSSSVESQKSDCSDLFITDGNYTQAPTTARFSVSGFDNKGALKKYKVEYGDGTNEEKADYRFTKQYPKAGTYVVRGYILDSRDAWKGGSGRCEKTLYVNTTPLTKQPSTGTPTYFTLIALTGGLWVLSMFVFRRQHLSR